MITKESIGVDSIEVGQLICFTYYPGINHRVGYVTNQEEGKITLWDFSADGYRSFSLDRINDLELLQWNEIPATATESRNLGYYIKEWFRKIGITV